MGDTDCGQKNMSTTTQDALYVNGIPIACHRLSDGNLYICRYENKRFCELVGESPVDGDICLAQHLLDHGTWHLFSQWREYGNGYVTGIISVYNFDMQDSGCRVRRRNDEVTIDLYVNFINELDDWSIHNLKNHPGNISWDRVPILVKEGIKLWEGWFSANDYDRFGLDQTLQVTVNIHERDSAESYSMKQQFIDIYAHRVGRSYQIEAKEGIFGWHYISTGDWKINNVGHVHLYTMYYDDINQQLIMHNETDFKGLAAHEMGHIFGLGDAYSEGERYTGSGNREVPKGDMMRYNGYVTVNDIEMMLLAWQENDQQYFVNERGHSQSKAIRLPY